MIRLALVLMAVLSGACASFTVHADQCPTHGTAGPYALTVQYLGSGGYRVQYRDVVLFGPQYTNPGLLEVTFEHQIRTDQALVDALLPESATAAKAIIVGHAHYDHAMDVPYVATAHAKAAKVYGSATLGHLIQSVVPSGRFVDVGPEAATDSFIAINARLRLWPIQSQHSDQTRPRVPLIGLDLPLRQWRGLVTTPQPRLPVTASEWAEGEVYAYVLDFLDESGAVAFRVYYQDSGTDRPIGYPTHVLADGRAVDVALLCIGGDITRLIDHPAGIIRNMRPRYVLLGHWEDFFAPQTDVRRTGRVQPLPGLDVSSTVNLARSALRHAGRDSEPLVPCPTSSIFYFEKVTR